MHHWLWYKHAPSLEVCALHPPLQVAPRVDIRYATVFYILLDYLVFQLKSHWKAWNPIQSITCRQVENHCSKVSRQVSSCLYWLMLYFSGTLGFCKQEHSSFWYNIFILFLFYCGQEEQQFKTDFCFSTLWNKEHNIGKENTCLHLKIINSTVKYNRRMPQAQALQSLCILGQFIISL